MPYSKDQIEQKVNRAIKFLLKNDLVLLQHDVNERSISHKLAEYLQTEFCEWNVDCEYNRNHDKLKSLKLPKRKSPLNDTAARTVFPDIIVHHRDTNYNLLVIEVKKSTSHDNSAFDQQKLNAFIKELHYQHGLFLKFSTGKLDNSQYNLKWYSKTQGST